MSDALPVVPEPDDPFAEAEEAFRRLEALGAQATPSAEAIDSLTEAPRAAIPCRQCEGVNRITFHGGVGAPAVVACKRCGQPIDPAEPFEIPARVLDEVIADTTATLVLVVSSPAHPLASLTGFMRPALASAGGRFVVGAVDARAHPEVAKRLGLPGAPALAFYQRGACLGSIALPQGLADLARGGGGGGGGVDLGRLLSGAVTGFGVPFPLSFPFPPAAPGGSSLPAGAP